MNDDDSFKSIGNAMRQQTLSKRKMERLANDLADKCQPFVDTYPIPDHLLSHCRKLHSVCPINFLLRSITTSLLFRLKLYVYLIFIEFVVKYKVQKLPNKYSVNTLFTIDFRHLFDTTLAPPTIEHVHSAVYRDFTNWILTDTLWTYMAQKLLSEPTIDIFSESFAKALMDKAIHVFDGKTLTTSTNQGRITYCMNKTGQMIKMNSN